MNEKLDSFEANKDKLDQIFKGEKKLSNQFNYLISIMDGLTKQLK